MQMPVLINFTHFLNEFQTEFKPEHVNMILLKELRELRVV
jgi:hypothetical protein